MTLERLERLVQASETRINPKLVKYVLDNLDSFYSGSDISNEVLYSKFFVKAGRIIFDSVDNGLDLRSFGWNQSNFSSQDLEFFYNYADLSIQETNSPSYLKQSCVKAIQNLKAHLYTDKARFAKELANLAKETSTKIYWLENGIEDCQQGINWAARFDPRHQVSQYIIKGELEIQLSQQIPETATKQKLLLQAFQDYEQAEQNCLDLDVNTNLYINAFKAQATQNLAILTEDLETKTLLLQTTIQCRGLCAQEVKENDPKFSATQLGYQAQAELDLAAISSVEKATQILENAFEHYSEAISLAHHHNRNHEAHLYSYRAEAARKRAELADDLTNKIFWKQQEYQDNFSGATKSKSFNPVHSAITFVNAGKAASELCELNNTHLDEAIACYSAFVNYFNESQPNEYLHLYRAIVNKVLPNLEKKKNPLNEPYWKIKRRETNRFRINKL